MTKRRIAVVIGTRPEAIKMAPVVRELRRSDHFSTTLVSTGQHRELLMQSLRVFDLLADVELALMRPSQTLPDLTARAITSLTRCFETIRPDAVLVQGDTTSVLCAGLAAFYQKIPVGHVEAGLRTGNMLSPWPEEMNRRLVTPLCTWNFAPTAVSETNLIREQIASDRCFVTGNTVVDALLWGADLVSQRGNSNLEICQRLGIPASFSEKFLESESGRFLLVTGHRRESFGEGIRAVCVALRELVESENNLGVVFPCHLNPNVKGPVMELLGNHPKIALISPVDYLDMIWLMRSSCFIISDSGGIQEEAPTLGKPVLVTRDTTERPEGIEAGTSILVGTNIETIVNESRLLLRHPDELQRRSRIANPYGDGTASQSIRRILESHFSSSGPKAC